MKISTLSRFSSLQVLLICLQLLANSGSLAKKNVFTSVESIKEALAIDDSIVHHLRQQLQQLNQYQASVAEYLKEWDRMRDGLKTVSSTENQKSKNDKIYTKIAENPLNALQIIRRLAIDVPRLKKQLDTVAKGCQNDMDMVQNDTKNLPVTYREDVKGAVMGLVRLQRIYYLSASDLVQGKIQHLQTSTRLSISDCLLMADESKQLKRLDLLVEWREQAHQLCLQEHSLSGQLSHCDETTGPLLTTAILEHDEIKKSYSQEQKKNASSQMEYVTFPEYVAKVPASQQKHYKDMEIQLKNRQNPMTLCYMGRRLLEPNEEAKLFCNYLTRPSDPYVTLQRFKVEVQSIKPMVLTIHDVVSSKEAKSIRKFAIPHLHRSGISTAGDPLKSVYDDHRISETAWLGDNYHPKITTISQRIQRITGLSTKDRDAEMLQVVNYGIGGLFNPHYDFLLSRAQVDQNLNETQFMGNRLLTFMLYLSDVKLGGCTTFPFAQLAVRPKKGSATMWYNLKENGNPDPYTMHGGCPVLYGSKWIANKWIMERGQLFRHPCPKTLQ